MNKTRGVSLIARTGSKINAPCSRRGETHFDAFDANLATRGVHASISDWPRTLPPASVSCFKSAALDASRDASGIVWGGSGGVSSSKDESELIGRAHRLGSRDASAASRRARSDAASGRPRARAARLRQGDSGDAGATEDGAVARSLIVRSPGDASPPVVSVASCPLVSVCVASSANSSSDESSDDGPSDDGGAVVWTCAPRNRAVAPPGSAGSMRRRCGVWRARPRCWLRCACCRPWRRRVSPRVMWTCSPRRRRRSRWTARASSPPGIRLGIESKSRTLSTAPPSPRRRPRRRPGRGGASWSCTRRRTLCRTRGSGA